MQLKLFFVVYLPRRRAPMKYLFAFLTILTLATMACGFSVNLPSVPTPGPEVTDEITVAIPESGEPRLKISFGAA